MTPSPVAAAAARAGVPLLRPERGRRRPRASPRCARSRRTSASWWRSDSSCRSRVRELPRLGYLINAHASLLPRHRGAAPIARAILAGDARDRHLGDARRARDGRGPGRARARDADRRRRDDRRARGAARRARRRRDRRGGRADRRGPRSRGPSRTPPARRSRRSSAAEDARLDWREAADALARRVRAIAPSPGAVTDWRGERLRILAARARSRAPRGSRPARVRRRRRGAAAHRDGRRLARAARSSAPAAALARRVPARRPIADGARSRGLTSA